MLHLNIHLYMIRLLLYFQIFTLQIPQKIRDEGAQAPLAVALGPQTRPLLGPS